MRMGAGGVHLPELILRITRHVTRYGISLGIGGASIRATWCVRPRALSRLQRRGNLVGNRQERGGCPEPQARTRRPDARARGIVKSRTVQASS